MSCLRAATLPITRLSIVWEAQLGIELAPRLQREAAMFWRLAEQRKGIEARDAMWAHPDLLSRRRGSD